MYSIISKLHSTFGTIGKTTADITKVAQNSFLISWDLQN